MIDVTFGGINLNNVILEEDILSLRVKESNSYLITFNNPSNVLLDLSRCKAKLLVTCYTLDKNCKLLKIVENKSGGRFSQLIYGKYILVQPYTERKHTLARQENHSLSLNGEI